MLGLILFVFVFYWIYTDLGHTAGTIMLVAGVIGFLVLGHSLSMDQWRAHRNWTEHWKKSGAERYAERRKWARDGRVLEEKRRVRTVPEQEETWRAYAPVSQSMQPARRREELFVCPRCGKMVRAESRRVLVGWQEMREYMCPRCRMRNRTEI